MTHGIMTKNGKKNYDEVWRQQKQYRETQVEL